MTKQLIIKNMVGGTGATVDIDRDDAGVIGQGQIQFQPPAKIIIHNYFSSPLYAYEIRFTGDDAKMLMKEIPIPAGFKQSDGEAMYKRAKKTQLTFRASGASIVYRSKNPFVPQYYMWIFSVQPIDKSKLPVFLQGMIPESSSAFVDALPGARDLRMS